MRTSPGRMRPSRFPRGQNAPCGPAVGEASRCDDHDEDDRTAAIADKRTPRRWRSAAKAASKARQDARGAAGIFSTRRLRLAAPVRRGGGRAIDVAGLRGQGARASGRRARRQRRRSPRRAFRRPSEDGGDNGGVRGRHASAEFRQICGAGSLRRRRAAAGNESRDMRGAHDGTPIAEMAAAYAEPSRLSSRPTGRRRPAMGRARPVPADQYLFSIAIRGQLGGQQETGGGRRVPTQTPMGPYDAIIGPDLWARSLCRSARRRRRRRSHPRPHAGRVVAGNPNDVRRPNRATSSQPGNGAAPPIDIHAATPFAANFTEGNDLAGRFQGTGDGAIVEAPTLRLPLFCQLLPERNDFLQAVGVLPLLKLQLAFEPGVALFDLLEAFVPQLDLQ